MTDQLRPLSPRPELLVGLTAPVEDPTDNSQVGFAGPVSRERCVTALPLNGTGPRLLGVATVIHDGFYLADPSGNLIGESDAVWVSRMLTAERTEDTRP